MNTAERESIGLCIVWEALGDMVNHSLLQVRAEDPGEATVLFRTRAHQEVFLIRLLDFSKEGGDETLTGVKGSCLDVLEAACRSKSFDVNGSVSLLEHSVHRMREWLETPTTFKLWLPTINVEVDLRVPRRRLLFISGNQAKHNVSRLTGLARNVQEMLRGHGHEVPLEQIPLALEDFTEHLNENFFVYYGTWLSELLNEVLWGMHQYLLPTFRACYAPAPEIDEYAYKYVYPAEIVAPVSRSWFWRLMNHVRSEPYLKRFRASKYMKLEDL